MTVVAERGQRVSGMGLALRQGGMEIRQFLRSLSFTEAEKDLMVLGLDEACTNVIRYAYGNAEDQLIRLSLERTAEGVRCRLRDYGCPVDASKMNGRQLEVVRPGGLGLHLIRQAFDTARYLRRPKGTELVLTKSLICLNRSAESISSAGHAA